MKRILFLLLLSIAFGLNAFGGDLVSQLEQKYRKDYGTNTLIRIVKRGEEPNCYYLVCIRDYDGVCDANGKEIIKPNKYTHICRHGKAPYFYYTVNIDKYEGICDANGKEIIAPIEYTSVYRHGEYPDFYYSVNKGEYEGICDVNGKEIFAPNKYSSVCRHGKSPDYFFSVNIGSQVVFLDKDGNESEYEKLISPTPKQSLSKPKASTSTASSVATSSTKPSTSKQSSSTSSSTASSAIASSAKPSTSKQSASSSGSSSMKIPCLVCNGTGTYYTLWGPMPCSFCGGRGYTLIHIDMSEINLSGQNMGSAGSPSPYIPRPTANSSEPESQARWESYYRGNYSKYEQEAKSQYNSIIDVQKSNSNGGYTAHDKYGSYTSSIVFRLHEVQKEMRNLRNEAAQKGIMISQSYWETVTVSYY